MCVCVYTHMGMYRGKARFGGSELLQGVEARLWTYFLFSFIWQLIGY